MDYEIRLFRCRWPWNWNKFNSNVHSMWSNNLLFRFVWKLEKSFVCTVTGSHLYGNMIMIICCLQLCFQIYILIAITVCNIYLHNRIENIVSFIRFKWSNRGMCVRNSDIGSHLIRYWEWSANSIQKWLKWRFLKIFNIFNISKV